MRYFRYLVLTLFLLGALLLVAFGPRPALPHPEGRIVVQYWEKWTGEEGAAMQQIVDDFNNSVGAEKNIFVQYLSLSRVDQKILIATSAGTPPDVAGMWYSQLEP